MPTIIPRINKPITFDNKPTNVGVDIISQPGVDVTNVSNTISKTQNTLVKGIAKEQEVLNDTWMLDIKNKFYENVEKKIPELLEQRQGINALNVSRDIDKIIVDFKSEVLKGYQTPVSQHQSLLLDTFLSGKRQEHINKAILHELKEYSKYEFNVYKTNLTNLVEEGSNSDKIKIEKEIIPKISEILNKMQERYGLYEEDVKRQKIDVVTDIYVKYITNSFLAGNIEQGWNELQELKGLGDNIKIAEINNLEKSLRPLYIDYKANQIVDSAIEEYKASGAYIKNNHISLEPIVNIINTKHKKEIEKNIDLSNKINALVNAKVNMHNNSVNESDRYYMNHILSTFAESNNKRKALNTEAADLYNPNQNVRAFSQLSGIAKVKLLEDLDRMQQARSGNARHLLIEQMIRYSEILNDLSLLFDEKRLNLETEVRAEKITPEHYRILKNLRENPTSVNQVKLLIKFINGRLAENLNLLDKKYPDNEEGLVERTYDNSRMITEYVDQFILDIVKKGYYDDFMLNDFIANRVKFYSNEPDSIWSLPIRAIKYLGKTIGEGVEAKRSIVRERLVGVPVPIKTKNYDFFEEFSAISGKKKIYVVFQDLNGNTARKPVNELTSAEREKLIDFDKKYKDFLNRTFKGMKNER